MKGQRKTYRILWVDDNLRQFSELRSRLQEELPASVSLASTLLSARQKLETDRFDVVILDMMLLTNATDRGQAIYGGLQVLEHLLLGTAANPAAAPNTPGPIVIFFTGSPFGAAKLIEEMDASNVYILDKAQHLELTPFIRSVLEPQRSG